MLIYKKIVVLSLFTGSLLSSSTAWGKRETTADGCPRVPSLQMVQAIKLAGAALKENQKVDELFADSAVLKCEKGAQVWEIGWRRIAYESGHLIVQVFEDGTVKHGKVIKDG